MNCEQVRRTLLAGPDTALPPAEVSALAAHLAACPACRRERERLVGLDQMLTHWVAAAPVSGESAIRRRLAAGGTRHTVRLRRAAATTGGLLGALAGRAALVVALVLAVVGLGASLGVPQARTLVQVGLRPFGGGEATLPVLPIAGDRVWIEGVAPAAEASLESRPRFELQLGYTLVSAPEALISVRLAADPQGETRYFAVPVRVGAGTNRALVRLDVDDARARQLLAASEVQIEVVMRAATTSGEAPLLDRTTYGRWRLPHTNPASP